MYTWGFSTWLAECKILYLHLKLELGIYLHDPIWSPLWCNCFRQNCWTKDLILVMKFYEWTLAESIFSLPFPEKNVFLIKKKPQKSSKKRETHLSSLIFKHLKKALVDCFFIMTQKKKKKTLNVGLPLTKRATQCRWCYFIIGKCQIKVILSCPYYANYVAILNLHQLEPSSY